MWILGTLRHPKITAFHVLLAGSIIGAVFGFFTSRYWNWLGPYASQISTGFFGLIGAVIGMIVSLIRWALNRRHKEAASKWQV